MVLYIGGKLDNVTNLSLFLMKTVSVAVKLRTETVNSRSKKPRSDRRVT